MTKYNHLQPVSNLRFSQVKIALDGPFGRREKKEKREWEFGYFVQVQAESMKGSFFPKTESI